MLTSFVTAALRVLRTSAFALAAICLAASSLYAANNKNGFTAFIVGNPADAQQSASLSPDSS